MMNGLCRTSLDLQDPKRIHIAWKSRVQKYFICSPLPWKNIIRQESNEASLLEESLETLLSQKCGQKAFWYFLKSEFCEENLDFWLACQEFQTCDSPEELTRRAASIYEEFIGDESPRQVNIDFYTREIISQSLQQPSPSCFVVAQKKIYSLMENGSFPRFIQSENYKVLFDGAVKQRRQTRSRHFPFPQNVTSTT
ncbi:putative regulator of G-protein signaling 21-like isoform 2 [Scophthalmus maximus]|uniref:Putative regulator of G-protein signaling 21-like isoform 2 n=1 Tax=Scophthalmus maximus TaxID=52904 RepID=A0A2U9BK26_SCOMX|nr:regulator of G-protein signaling 21 isoform X1 [Scophthalmus maximus]AWP04415.1 putative regulator of G-protein signaling 21-like isoform 2 [Scophthalmus maximus]